MIKKLARNLALSLVALLSPWALAQSITIPAQTIKTQIIINGVAVPVSVPIPAQIINLPTPPPATGFPAGITYTNGVLTVKGSISADSISLTGGTNLPVSSSGLYVLQLTGGFLHPVPYVPFVPVKTP